MALKRRGEDEEGGGEGKDGSRASWTKETVHTFLDLCMQCMEKSKGKSGATISQRIPWKILEEKFRKKTGLTYDHGQLKNKSDYMKRRWNLWKALKGKETGLGWDHEKRTISASDEWWKKKLEENSKFSTFQEEGIDPELESKMEQVFGISVAQGTLKFTPSQIENEPTYIPSPSNPNVDNAFNGYDDVSLENYNFDNSQTNMEWQEIWNEGNPIPSSLTSPQTNDDGVQRKGSKRIFENDAYESHKKPKAESSKKGGGSTLLMEKLDAMVQVITERNKKDIELINLEAQTISDSSLTIADSLAKLVSLPGLIPCTPEFDFACTLIEDPQKRIILNGLPSDDARLHWIKYLFEKQH